MCRCQAQNLAPLLRSELFPYNTYSHTLISLCSFSCLSHVHMNTQVDYSTWYWQRLKENSPFNRVPIGSPPLLINTHALSSNRTTLPSGRWYFFFVRTTTACRISPLRTLVVTAWAPPPPAARSAEPRERCFWTTMTILSPIAAWRFMPRTLAHSTMAAPC